MLVYHKDYRDFLVKLRDAGVVHVSERKSGVAETPELQDMLQLSNRYLRIIKNVERFLPEKPQLAAAVTDKAPAALDKAETMFTEIERLKQQLQLIEKDITSLAIWGDFDYTLIEKLSNAGYAINFFQTTVKGFNPEWSNLYNAIIVNQTGSKLCFVTVTHTDVVVDIDAETAKLPSASLSGLKAEADSTKAAIATIEENLRTFAVADIETLRAGHASLQQNMEFSKVMLNGEKVSGDKLLLLEGWVPEQEKESLVQMLDGESLFYELDRPQPGDDVPIRFNNNGFFRLFEPICELYMLPKYNELDLTPFFAPFYMIFFGLCLGDMGYGLVMSLVSIALLAGKKVSGSMKGYVNLVLTLGLSTMLCGSLTGTFFGFNLYEWNIPLLDWWRDHVSFSAMNPETGKLNDPNPMLFNLSLILGGIQIFYGMIIKVVNITIQTGFKYALSTLGWLIILFTAVVSMLVPSIPVTVTYVLYGIGAVGVFLLNSPGQNPILNIGLGLWDTYNMVTGLLGDILSYVRLFALGLSGGILAMVFNSLATGMSPDNAILGPVVTVLIFVIGHFINMFMNVLGALVHPMRLTFVEFFKNSGYEGGGKAYKPFKQTI